MPMFDRRFDREGVAQILAALFGRKFGLGGRWPDAAATAEVERNVQSARYRARDFDGLVETAPAVPARMEGDRDDRMGLFVQCRQLFRHQGAQESRARITGSEFQRMNQMADRFFVAEQGKGRMEAQGALLAVSANLGNGRLERNGAAWAGHGVVG